MEAWRIDRLSAEQATAAIEHATKRLDGWAPGNVSLANAVERAFREAALPASGRTSPERRSSSPLVSSSVPSGLEQPSVPTIASRLTLAAVAGVASNLRLTGSSVARGPALRKLDGLLGPRTSGRRDSGSCVLSRSCESKPRASVRIGTTSRKREIHRRPVRKADLLDRSSLRRRALTPLRRAAWHERDGASVRPWSRQRPLESPACAHPLSNASFATW